MSPTLVQALAAVVAVGVVVSIFTGPIGLAVTVPLGLLLFVLMRHRQRSARDDAVALAREHGMSEEELDGMSEPRIMAELRKREAKLRGSGRT